MGQIALLGLVHVLHHGPRGDDAGGTVPQPQSVQGGNAVVLLQDPPAAIIRKEPGVQGGYVSLAPVLQLIHVYAGHKERLVAHDL